MSIPISYQLRSDFNLTPEETAICLAGYLIGLLGLKAQSLLMFYPIWHRTRYPGSHLVSSFIALVPTFGFYSSAMYALTAQLAEAKWYILVPFLIFSYVLFSLLFGGFLYVSEKMQSHRFKSDDARSTS